MSVRDLMVIVQSSTAGADPDEWLAKAVEVLEWAKSASPGRKRVRPRLVLTGAPMIWPNFKPLNLIEECGADVVADTLCSGVGGAFDPVVVTEKSTSALLSALAQRYIFGSACPCFISPATRISRVLDLVHEHRADGVLHYGLRLCQLFDIELYRLSALLKERKIPFMNLRTDYSLEDTEQLRVRLEAFLETLEG
jgi:benzoyl-CoA reductase/2-hydroxyglutaryl-CoA dehydratase subunit BcrC/BadD/HgdB